MTIRVVVADDQPIVRAGVVMLLSAQRDVEVVGEAADGAEVLAVTETTGPDVVVMDLQMPGVDGIAATRSLTADRRGREDRPLRVLALTTFDDERLVLNVLRAGASGFVLKQSAPSDLAAAVRAVVAGEAWIDRQVAPSVLRAVNAAPRPDGTARQALAALTPRERELLEMMAHGLTNQEIARELVLSEATVKTHVSRILLKTGSHDRTQAVVLAYQGGLVVPGVPRTRRP